MALLSEENFKICGLCSQLVDESVQLNSVLRAFLIEFLSLNEDQLPTKTCMECYQRTTESKRFKDSCNKSIDKLQRNNVYSSMILGRSKNDKNDSRAEPNTPKAAGKPIVRPKAGPASQKKKKILESLGLDPSKIDIDISAGRSSRSQAAFESATPATGLRSKAPPGDSRRIGPASATRKTERKTSRSSGRQGGVEKSCRIVIKKTERQRADRHLAKFGVARNTNTSRKRGLVETPVSSELSGAPPAKRLRKGYALEPVIPQEAPLPAKRGSLKKEDESLSRSSFGRARNPTTKKGYVYDNEDASPPPATTRSERRTSSKAPAAVATPKSSSNKRSVSPKKTVVIEPEPEDDDDEEEEDDVEEVFPTIGPYQCEICQVITDTKAEFVAHIKAKHRDVVDEEVLKSLESDIRKSKKKQTTTKGSPASKKKASPPKKVKPAPKPAPKPSSPAKKKKKMGPKSKDVRGRPKKTVTTPSPRSAASLKSPTSGAQRAFMCDVCDTVLSRSNAHEINKHKKSKACVAAGDRKKQEDLAKTSIDDPLGETELEKIVDDVAEVHENGDNPINPLATAINGDDVDFTNGVGGSLDNADTNGGFDDPTVVMDNAEEDILPQQHQGEDILPQQQQDDGNVMTPVSSGEYTTPELPIPIEEDPKAWVSIPTNSTANGSGTGVEPVVVQSMESLNADGIMLDF
jgi:hypothetical protein